ncbi:MAG: DUF499 domain-containing protein, partial [Clostridia bacterium]
RTLGPAERNYVGELRDVRNRWAHQQALTTPDTIRALDTMARLLGAIHAPQGTDIEGMHRELLRTHIDEQTRQQVRRQAVRPTEGTPQGGLRPWREVITPHPDVSSGRYQQAEFAADLRPVMEGTASPEYGDPREFFQRTYLTEGLMTLATKALQRLGGTGGDPVVELQTNFGGGKTHALLALYHLCSGVRAGQLPGVEELVRRAGVDLPTPAHRAVLVGTALAPGQASVKPDGTTVATLWGELAWQLGGAEAYARVADADRSGTSPGSDVLRALFATYSPCLILIDEFVAYVRQLYQRTGLPGGSYESALTFTQALTEAVTQTDRTLLVVSVPASDIEIGGEGERAALAGLKNILSRVEVPWTPASTEEGYEIVRRRLFLPLADAEHFQARDLVLQQFSGLYREHPAEYPTGVGEQAYLRRLEQAYPIHPSLFDQLYNTWSTVDRFQRTRGVLRLMAMVVHALWERGDQSLMILPSMVPIDSPEVESELTRYLEDRWTTAIERDVDGPNSLPLQLDNESPRFGRLSAARRVSRTIYLGTAPLVRASTPGIDSRTIRLGCVQPGENAGVFDDALRYLSERAVHLFRDGERYWFSTQPSVTSLAQDRAAQWDREPFRIWAEVQRRLQGARQSRGAFAAVHVFPETSGEVPDEEAVRLVVIPPEHPHILHADDSPAIRWARDVLAQRGTAPRYRRNTLLFLAADAARVNDLRAVGATFLAWDSLDQDAEALDLTPFQRRQVSTQRDQAGRILQDRLGETFACLLIPTQVDPAAGVTWPAHRLTGTDSLYMRASKRAVALQALYEEYAPALLAQDVLRAYYWPTAVDVSPTELWDHLTTYLYMPRLQDRAVLVGSISTALGLLTNEDFAYAEGLDGEGRYLNLRYQGAAPSTLSSHGRLVRPDVATAQMDAGRKREDAPAPPEPVDPPKPGPRKPEPTVPVPSGPRSFHAVAHLNALRLQRDVDTIAQEVVAHIASLVGADVTVSLEIHARFREPAPPGTVRTVEENCRTLHFDLASFEAE